MSLDLRAARRQALTTSFRAQDVAALKAGRLRMSPHPEWRLPADPTWQEDPFSDRNWCFQFHMLRWLDPLRRAAGKGDDDAYALWLRWIRDWTAKNPHDAPASSWAWTDMSDGIRAQQLCLSAPMVAERSPELLEWLEELIRVHAEHLADPAHMGRANHALHQQESLFVCGRVLGEQRLWDLALERMSALLLEQYDEQGMNAEGATAYHVNNYLWWEKALQRIDLEGLERPAGAERHLSAPEEIAHATRPDGTLVAIGDTDTVSPTAVDSPLTRYVTSDGKEGVPPSSAVKVYDAGYVFSRSGWGDAERPFSAQTFFSLRFGAAQSVHGHPDGGSLTYSADGVNWIADLGKFQYGRGTVRDHVVSRAAHSVVSIEGRRPRRDAHVELVSHRLAPDLQEFVLQDDSFEGVELRRRVVHSTRGEYLVVIDDVRADDEVRALQRWQLGPDVDAAEQPDAVERPDSAEQPSGDDGLRRMALEADGRRALLAFGGDVEGVEQVRGQEDPFDGWVSTGWKRKAAATAVTASARGTRIRLVTVLAAGGEAVPRVRSRTELVAAQPTTTRRIAAKLLRGVVRGLTAREHALTTMPSREITAGRSAPPDISLEISVGAVTEGLRISTDEVLMEQHSPSGSSLDAGLRDDHRRVAPMDDQ